MLEYLEIIFILYYDFLIIGIYDKYNLHDFSMSSFINFISQISKVFSTGLINEKKNNYHVNKFDFRNTCIRNYRKQC